MLSFCFCGCIEKCRIWIEHIFSLLLCDELLFRCNHFWGNLYFCSISFFFLFFFYLFFFLVETFDCASTILYTYEYIEGIWTESRRRKKKQYVLSFSRPACLCHSFWVDIFFLSTLVFCFRIFVQFCFFISGPKKAGIRNIISHANYFMNSKWILSNKRMENNRTRTHTAFAEGASAVELRTIDITNNKNWTIAHTHTRSYSVFSAVIWFVRGCESFGMLINCILHFTV